VHAAAIASESPRDQGIEDVAVLVGDPASHVLIGQVEDAVGVGEIQSRRTSFATSSKGAAPKIAKWNARSSPRPSR